MRKHLNRPALLGAIAVMIGLAAGMDTIGYAKTADCNGLTATALPVVELGVPLNKTLPVKIIPGPVKSLSH